MSGVTTRDALADLRRLIAAGAISAHARGDVENERRWLDAQILLDRVPVIDAAALADDEALVDRVRDEAGLTRGSNLVIQCVLHALPAALSERTS